MTRPPERPVFFIDRSLGSRDVADALRQAGAQVIIHDDEFDQATEDHEWLSVVGERGWVVLTKDSRIRRHPLEMTALVSAGVAAFILTAQDLSGGEMGRLFTTALPRMEQRARTLARPFVATIARSGEITIKHGGGRRGGARGQR